MTDVVEKTKVYVEDHGPELPRGSYVLATKYGDGAPGDPWAVGFYLKRAEWGRHLVGDKAALEGTSPYPDGYYRNGYRKVRAGLRDDVGDWLVKNSAILEKSPPGSVNLWTMLTDAAFEVEENATGVGGESNEGVSDSGRSSA